MSVGEDLANARHQAGLSVLAVSQRTCIRETIIRDIERDDFRLCGGDFYARGHIRSIARAVGTDPGPFIQDYDAAHPAPRPARPADLFGPVIPIERQPRRRANWVVVTGLALVLMVGFGVYYLVSGGQHAPSGHAAGARAGQVTHPRAASRPQPPAPGAAAAAQPYAHRVVIRLVALQGCWVEFTTPAGRYLFQAYVPGGTAKKWIFRYAVDMQLGNPAGIRLRVDGKNPLRPGPDNPVTLRLGLRGKISG